jgi:hypothetical protein
MFLDHDDLDADEVDMRGDELAGSKSVQQASSSRARMLAQQRELQQRKKQQSLSAAGKRVWLGLGRVCVDLCGSSFTCERLLRVCLQG